MWCASCTGALSRAASRALLAFTAGFRAGSPVVFPNPAKIPALMQDFAAWLQAAAPATAAAFEAHFRLAAIHPFGDGNGRTARLLMNLLLIREGYPPVAVRPEDRKAYLDALERGSLTGDPQPFQSFMHERLDAALDAYLSILRETLPEPSLPGKPASGEPTPQG